MLAPDLNRPRTIAEACRRTSVPSKLWSIRTTSALAGIVAMCLCAAPSMAQQPLPQVPQNLRPPAPRRAVQVNPAFVPAEAPVEEVADQSYPYPGMMKVLDGGVKDAGRNADVGEDRIQRWVRDLDADVFTTRKLASAELAQVGKRMIPILLQEIVDRNSLEQRHRGIQLLRSMATGKRIEDEAAAYDALRTLAKTPHKSLNTRASRSLVAIKKTYKGRAIKRLRANGAVLSQQFVTGAPINGNVNGIGGPIRAPMVSTSEGGNHLVLNEEWHGNASDLEMVRFLTNIEEVVLEGPKITDEFLESISYCRRLRSLKIRKANITDAGMEKLEALKELAFIDIRYTKITDKSLPTLGSFQLARWVRLFGTDIAHDKQESLAASLPNATLIDIRQGGFLGVGARYRLDGQSTPCIIDRPVANSAAEEAQLQQDDIVLKYDGKPVSTFDELREHIAANSPGDEIVLVIKRGDKVQNKKVKLREWSDRY